METVEIKSWTLQTSLPPGEGQFPALILLHGWTGDETSMWVFSKRLQTRYAVFAPRGIYAAPRGGFGWHNHQSGKFPQVVDFQPASDAVFALLDDLAVHYPQVDFTQPSWMGFSQGGGLLYTLAMQHPQRVKFMAGLASFLPNGALPLVKQRPLAGKSVFVAHGRQDELVPVARARQSVQLLQEAGAQVYYCEDDTGHNVSLHCMRQMEIYWGVRAQPELQQGEDDDE